MQATAKGCRGERIVYAPIDSTSLKLTDWSGRRELGRVGSKLRGRGLRVELDESSEKLGAKIRDAQLAKLPYTLVVGDKETEAKAVSPRRHGEGKDAELPAQPLSEFADKISKEALVPY